MYGVMVLELLSIGVKGHGCSLVGFYAAPAYEG